MRKVYLDNNATTPVSPTVVEAMRPFLEDVFGNASSIHSFGQAARSGVERARRQVASLIGAQESEIIFTCGGTEADNLAICGAVAGLGRSGGHIVTSRIEHPAVLRACEWLERQGYDISYLGVDSEGRISPEQVEAALRKDTLLVSVMTANNETGTVQPIPEIAEITSSRGILLHTDAVQAVAKTPVDVKTLKVDLLSLSGHKFHGPKGVGALFVRRGVALEPLIRGGGQERGRRGGTENVPGIVGLGQACEEGANGLVRMESEVRALRDRLESAVLDGIEGSSLNGPPAVERLPHVSNLSFEGVDGESLLVALDFQGIAVSTGAACSSGSVSPSHVLSAMHLPEGRVSSAIRFSLSQMTVVEEIERLLEVLPGTVTRIREAAASLR